MRLPDLLRLAVKPFRTRILESLLIVVGVAIGVGVVTTMLTLILASTDQLRSFQNSLSAREVRLAVRAQDFGAFYDGDAIVPVLKVGRADDQPVRLSIDDLEPIKKAVSGAQFAYLKDYTVIQQTGQNGKPASELAMQAVTADYIQADKLELLLGTWPSKADFAGRARVVVITEFFAKQRFGAQNPVGQRISAEQGSAYKIVGVFRPPAQSTEYASERFANAYLGRGIVPWGISDFMTMTERELKFSAPAAQQSTLLEGLRGYVSKRWGDRISVKSSSELIKKSSATALSAAIVVALFASGGLLIAAINITNLMLARVIGRTRGIGVAGALGASRQMLFLQFLSEALMLGLVGGLFGLLCAWGLSAGLNAALTSNSAFVNDALILRLEPLNLLLGLLLGLGVSVLFGIYPALVASRIRPAEALRG